MRDTAEVALMISVGYILHLITPPILMGMKPDFVLGMLFVVILMKKDFKLALTAGIAAGLITAMTTTFPGGQIANIIDKLLTTLFMFGVVRLLENHLNEKLLSGLSGAIGTLFSGAAFLLSALLLVGLPASFGALFATVVLPATVVNTIAVIVL